MTEPRSAPRLAAVLIPAAIILAALAALAWLSRLTASPADALADKLTGLVSIVATGPIISVGLTAAATILAATVIPLITCKILTRKESDEK